MDTGYLGDSEYDADHVDSDSGQVLIDDCYDGPEKRHCRHLFFADIPSRRKRAVNLSSVASSEERSHRVQIQSSELQGSQYDQARWLSHYFWNQNPMEQRTPGTNDDSPSAISDSESMYERTCSKDTRNEEGAPKLVASCHHIPLEESISFSTRPRYVLISLVTTIALSLTITNLCRRIVIEADAPHRVVHTNGAYEVYFGYTARLAASSFQAPNVNSLEEFETAVVNTLFDPSKAGSLATLIMYPVLGAERSGGVPLVTHYLIEANNCTLSSPKARGRWRGTGAQ